MPIRQPVQELPVPVGRVGRHRFGLSALPFGEAREHVLRGNCFLAHPGCRRLHSHNHAAVIVHQVVVVVTEASRCAALGGIGRIGIGGRHLLLLMHRFFYRVLLFQFLHILSHGVIHLRRFPQLLPWDAALLRRVCFHCHGQLKNPHIWAFENSPLWAG